VVSPLESRARPGSKAAGKQNFRRKRKKKKKKKKEEEEEEEERKM